MAERKINGETYKVEPLTAPEAYKLLAEILLLAGTGSQHLPAIIKGQYEDEDGTGGFAADIAAFAAVSSMIRDFGMDAFVDFKRRVIETAMIKRPSGPYEHVSLEAEFIGDLVSAEKVFDFVIEEQFGPFSKGSEASGPVALALILIRNVFQVSK